MSELSTGYQQFLVSNNDDFYALKLVYIWISVKSRGFVTKTDNGNP